MRTRLRIVATFVCVLGLFAAHPVVIRTAEVPRLIVHEWGTFTSIAGPDGQAIEWLPSTSGQDLPCFVLHSGPFKSELPSLSRMETPVLYFYSPIAQRVNVTVRFPEGRMTEWFPNPSAGPTSATRNYQLLNWQNVEILPAAAEDFPRDHRPSHYYAARATDASPIHAGGAMEKFLFYRGVGTFAPPVSAIVRQDDRVLVWNPSGEPLGDVVLFQRRGNTTSFQVRHVLTPQTTFDAPSSAASGSSAGSGPPRAESRDGLGRTDSEDDTLDARQTLEQILIANGLYAKEAAAMVNTWRESWFEEGTHLYYIVSPATVDALLPLDITPTPDDVQRVFVGRIELASQATLKEIRTAVQSLDFVPLAKYGRFLPPLAERVIAERPVNDHKLLRQRIAWASISESQPDNRPCGK